MIVSLTAVLLLVAALAVLTRSVPETEITLVSYGSDAAFLDNFSPRRYTPMLRLATQMDRRYLAAVHGAELASCYRRIQRGLLREYLRDASKDFNRLYSIANAKCLRAGADPGDLSMQLFEQQLAFILLVWGIEARLLLDGCLPFALDPQPLIQSIEGIAQLTRELAQPRFGYQAA